MQQPRRIASRTTTPHPPVRSAKATCAAMTSTSELSITTFCMARKRSTMSRLPSSAG
ncbi:hypothetical protein GT347_18470 [Xylophilus rhododendri]|uniref:Uncharacterized protein n=1 Tax=Xylophilus rhododendri TaxID=2697032 RepID=A0A857J9S0_9BURK|nr:hypothetical protein [Xylophilus rhododendri]QHI99789.1 hypothetical protein GT347_18470 [Xylophilus rhododendri]